HLQSTPSVNNSADAAGAKSEAASATPATTGEALGDPNTNYAKTLRLTSDQLKALNLRPGPNEMTFSVNKATCTAYMYLWSYTTPIVISDIDGTITKSDALGHVLNMIGRDWTHLGVAKLYTDIVNNGYNIMYLTSRSTGQADTTRAYLSGVLQEGYRLPRGPVIMSPDRTMAALRREIYLRKPEVFKMACLRDILSLFRGRENPFYAGFGNRLTDALSYRSVNIPSSRIFTINSSAEVYMDLLSLNKYKSSYVSMRELVDHFFPPVATLVQEGGEQFTDFNYWRQAPLDLDGFSLTDSEAGSSVGREEEEEEEELLEEELEEEYFDEEDEVDEYDDEEEEMEEELEEEDDDEDYIDEADEEDEDVLQPGRDSAGATALSSLSLDDRSPHPSSNEPDDRPRPPSTTTTATAGRSRLRVAAVDPDSSLADNAWPGRPHQDRSSRAAASADSPPQAE
ncbi:hypothetical protein KEM52_001655, partial [Ascosphaera acerosa]